MRDDEIFRAGAGEDFQRHPSTSAPYVNHPTLRTTVGRPSRVLYGRPSNFGAQIEDRWGLQRWSERNVLLGTTLLPTEVQAAIQRLNLDDATDRKLGDGWVVDAKGEAGAFLKSARGSMLHAATTLDHSEADPLLALMAYGEEQLGVPGYVTDAVLDAWGRLLKRHELHVLAVEQTVIDDRWRLAGTLDRVVQLGRDLFFGAHILPAGTVLVLDIKTGRLTIDRGHPAFWHAYSVQVASYSHSVPYRIEGLVEEREEWPWPVDQRHGLIAHLDLANALDEGVATAQLVHVDLVEGHRAGNLCRQARDWQSSRAVFAMHNADPVATNIREQPF